MSKTDDDFNLWAAGYFSWVEKNEQMPKDHSDLMRMVRDAFDAGRAGVEKELEEAVDALRRAGHATSCEYEVQRRSHEKGTRFHYPDAADCSCGRAFLNKVRS